MPAYDKAATLRYLDERNIPYELVEHEAVLTMEALHALGLPFEHEVVKNLFLRDDKKRNYYLVTTAGEVSVDLKGLRAALGSRPLSFASEHDLAAILGLAPGAVTPLGILNDEARRTEVVIDEALRDRDAIGVHPCDNTATMRIALSDLFAIFEEHGTPYRFVRM